MNMKLHVAAYVVACFSVHLAFAGGPTNSKPPVVAVEPSTPLDRARTICERHRAPLRETSHMFPANPPILPPEYAEGWQMCWTVETLWQRTEAARREREARAAEDADRAFVDQFVNNYGKP